MLMCAFPFSLDKFILNYYISLLNSVILLNRQNGLGYDFGVENSAGIASKEIRITKDINFFKIG